MQADLQGITQQKQDSQKLPRMNAHEYESKIHHLIEQNEILESKLRHTNDNKSKLLNKLKEFEDDNDRYKNQIARQAYQNKTQEDELNRVNSKIHELLNSNKNLNDKCRTKFEVLNKELEDKDNQLIKAISQTKAKDETIKYYSVNNEQIIRYQSDYKEELESVQREKVEKENRIRTLERQIDELYINRKSEAAMSLEIDHLKEDNIRLLQLLKTTSEFKDFAYLAEDVSGGIRYVRSTIDQNIKRPKSSMRIKDKMHYEKVTPRNDLNWVPNEAYSYAFEFRNKNNLELSDMLLEELLFSVIYSNLA
jgi:chromosome segregation ATPase